LTSLLTMSCALFFQENSLLFPFYAAALLFFMTDASPLKIVRTVVPYIFLNLLLLIPWLITASHTAHMIQSIQSFQLTFWDWSANFFRLVAWYIKNLFIPQNIIFEYSRIPVSKFSFLWNIFSWCVLTGYVLLILYYFKRTIESFALVIFITGFIYAVPASLAHPDIGLVFEPHWLYFSSTGFFLFMSLMFIKLKKRVHRLLYLALASTILMSFFIDTQRLQVNARNELSYCENWLKISPHNTYAMFLLAKHYCINKDLAIPPDLIPDMINTVDFLIKNNFYISAPKLIEKLSSCRLSPSQRRELLLKSEIFHSKYGGN
jgi:hypothetical protein